MKSRHHCLNVALLLLLLVSCKFEDNVLHVYSAFDIEESKYYLQKYEEQSGIDVIWSQMPTGEILGRIEEEKKAPKASIWLAGPNTAHINAEKKGLLENYKPYINFDLPAQYHDKDWAWTAIYSGAIGFITNKKYLDKLNIEAPISWDDLLRKEFENKISIAYPYTSGTAYTVWAGRIQILGLDGAVKWWKSFDKQIYQYTKSGTACIDIVGEGEAAVGIAFSHDILSKGIKRNYPVVLTFPKEGTSFELGAVSLIKGAPEKKQGRKFINWILSEEGQNLFKQYNRVPVNPKAVVDPDSIKLSDVKLIDYNFFTAGENKDTYVSVWRQKIGR